MPDSLRAYHRALEEGTVEDGQPTSSDPVKSNVILQSPVKTAVKHKAPVSNTRRRFRKIEDVESDLSDNGNEGGPSNTSSSVAGDHDSDMPLDKASRKSSGASVARNKPQNAAISQSTNTSASDTNSCKMGGVELAIVRQPESHHRGNSLCKILTLLVAERVLFVCCSEVSEGRQSWMHQRSNGKLLSFCPT